jgi:predicted aspartyl protease
MRGWFGPRALLPVLLLSLLLAGCAEGGDSCKLVWRAEMPIVTRNNLMFVEAQFDGKPATMVLDTGAERTLLTETAVNRLRLKRDLRHPGNNVGVGGVSSTYQAVLDEFAVGAFELPVDSVTVGTFTLPEIGGVQPDGLLGADILLAFDLDIDLQDHRLTIYRARSCPDSRPPWTVPYASVNGVITWRDQLALPLALNGAKGLAILDTGAQSSVIRPEFAERAGVTQAMLEADPVRSMRGASREELSFRLHRFNTIQIGTDTAHDVPLPVAALPNGQQDALIGGDFLHGRRIWLSATSHQIFFTPPKQ